MIINFGNEVKTNLEDNKVQLDINDTDYLLSLITTRLYSDPIGSFLREIVSNANDSHKEAGNPDPVLIEVGYHKLTSKYYFRIQDYGTGISTEKFNEIYRKAGKSTRRDTNIFLGGYGYIHSPFYK